VWSEAAYFRHQALPSKAIPGLGCSLASQDVDVFLKYLRVLRSELNKITITKSGNNSDPSRPGQ
jgi:hypothetical protein